MAAQRTAELSMKLRLSEQARQQLEQRAAQSGRDLADYTSELVENAVSASSIEELLAPVHADVATSGMSDEQIMNLGQAELEALRRERKAKSA